MTDSPAALEAKAEASREALMQDVGSLKRKLRPKQMMRDTAQKAQTGARRVADRVARRAKADPVPFVMGGALAGAALLIGLMSRRGARHDRRRMD